MENILCSHKENPLECASYPFCWGCNAFKGSAEDMQQQLDESFEHLPYDVKLNTEKNCWPNLDKTKNT